MDGMSGLDLQKRLAVDHPSLPIIFITALDDAVTNQRISRSGIPRLHKPFDDYMLLDAIKRALDQGPMGGGVRAA
jgi:FixJ family two-component response regulator